MRAWRRVRPAPVTEAERTEFAAELDIVARLRPRHRSQCIDGPRPCPWVSCRYHLGLEVTPDGKLVVRVGAELEDMIETCALDAALTVDATDGAGHGMLPLRRPEEEAEGGPSVGSLGWVGLRMGVTKEYARQIEEIALEKLRKTEAGRRLAAELATAPRAKRRWGEHGER